jgi:hypothetical protein
LGKRAHRVADEDLAGMCLRADPSRDVDRPADVALGRLDGLAGVHSDPDADGRFTRRRGILGAADDGHAALDRARDGRKDDVEAIALSLDLRAVESTYGEPDERSVARQQLRSRTGTVRLDITGVVAEVGEQEATRRLGGVRPRRPVNYR